MSQNEFSLKVEDQKMQKITVFSYNFFLTEILIYLVDSNIHTYFHVNIHLRSKIIRFFFKRLIFYIFFTKLCVIITFCGKRSFHHTLIFDRKPYIMNNEPFESQK